MCELTDVKMKREQINSKAGLRRYCVGFFPIYVACIALRPAHVLYPLFLSDSLSLSYVDSLTCVHVRTLHTHVNVCMHVFKCIKMWNIYFKRFLVHNPQPDSFAMWALSPVSTSARDDHMHNKLHICFGWADKRARVKWQSRVCNIIHDCISMSSLWRVWYVSGFKVDSSYGFECSQYQL